MGACSRSASGSERGADFAGRRATAIVTIEPWTLPAEFESTKHPWEIVTRSPAETAAVGKALAGFLRDGDLVLLHGDLGAGKTTLAKGIASALGVGDVVSSPSFSLVNEYD